MGRIPEPESSIVLDESIFKPCIDLLTRKYRGIQFVVPCFHNGTKMVTGYTQWEAFIEEACKTGQICMEYIGEDLPISKVQAHGSKDASEQFRLITAANFRRYMDEHTPVIATRTPKAYVGLQQGRYKVVDPKGLRRLLQNEDFLENSTLANWLVNHKAARRNTLISNCIFVMLAVLAMIVTTRAIA